MPTRVNYASVAKQVSRLRALATDHRRDADRLDAIRSDLAARWPDPAGSAYTASAERLATSMRQTANSLSRLAADLQNASDQFRQQEEAAAKAAGGLQS